MEIRILPMSKENPEFIGKSVKEVQNDFFATYINEGNPYYYEEKGLNANPGDLVLFQMDSTIIASAEFLTDCKDDRTLFFKENTVKVFKPIDEQELKKCIPEFKSFSHAKPQFDSINVNMETLEEKMSLLDE